MIFGKKRFDGKLVQNADPLVSIMPYLFKGRNESVVYYRKTISLSNIENFIKTRKKEGIRYTQFAIIIASLMHTCYKRPNLNRFIAGSRTYQRDVFDIQYTAKQKMTDDANESLAKLVLSKDDTLADVQRKLFEANTIIKSCTLKEDDKFIRFMIKLPRFVLKFISFILYKLDYYSALPKSLADLIPFFSSVFISNLASIGAEAAYHHLYEFGTTSIFVTMGRAYERTVVGKDNRAVTEKVFDLAFTVDERICDGFYLINSLRILEKILAFPEFLEHSFSEGLDIFSFSRKKKYASDNTERESE